MISNRAFPSLSLFHLHQAATTAALSSRLLRPQSQQQKHTLNQHSQPLSQSQPATTFNKLQPQTRTTLTSSVMPPNDFHANGVAKNNNANAMNGDGSVEGSTVSPISTNYANGHSSAAEAANGSSASRRSSLSSSSQSQAALRHRHVNFHEETADSARGKISPHSTSINGNAGAITFTRPAVSLTSLSDASFSTNGISSAIATVTPVDTASSTAESSSFTFSSSSSSSSSPFASAVASIQSFIHSSEEKLSALFRRFTTDYVYRSSFYFLIAFLSFSVAYFLFFSWTAHFILFCFFLSIISFIIAILIFSRQYGLLSLAAPEYAEALLSFSLVDYAQMGYPAHVYLDVFSLLLFPLTHSETQRVLQRLPRALRDTLTRKGIVYFFPEVVRRILLPASVRESLQPSPSHSRRIVSRQEIEAKYSLPAFAAQRRFSEDELNNPLLATPQQQQQNGVAAAHNFAMDENIPAANANDEDDEAKHGVQLAAVQATGANVTPTLSRFSPKISYPRHEATAADFGLFFGRSVRSFITAFSRTSFAPLVQTTVSATYALFTPSPAVVRALVFSSSATCGLALILSPQLRARAAASSKTAVTVAYSAGAALALYRLVYYFLEERRHRRHHHHSHHQHSHSADHDHELQSPREVSVPPSLTALQPYLTPAVVRFLVKVIHLPERFIDALFFLRPALRYHLRRTYHLYCAIILFTSWTIYMRNLPRKL